MDIETRKSRLINWLKQLNDEKTIARIENLQKQEEDWLNALSNDDRKAIEEGVNQLNQGNFLAQEEFRSKINERFNF